MTITISSEYSESSSKNFSSNQPLSKNRRFFAIALAIMITLQRATEVKAAEKVKKTSNKKLAQVGVEVIRALFNHKLATLKMLADAFGMSETAIGNPLNRITNGNEVRKIRRISAA